MALNKISRNRRERIDRGELKTAHNSTFKQMTAEQFRSSGLIKRASKTGLYDMGLKAQKRSPRTIAKRRAWTQFSLFIRLRDSDQHGRGQCCTCPRRAHWKKLQAGHYITRAKEATLFHEKNSHSQCPNCNRFQGGRPVEYRQFLRRKYGPEIIDELEILSVQQCKRDINDYIAIERHYAGEAQRLRVLKAQA